MKSYIDHPGLFRSSPDLANPTGAICELPGYFPSLPFRVDSLYIGTFRSPLAIAASSSSVKSSAVRYLGRCRSAACSSPCRYKGISSRVDGRFPERDLFSNCFTTPSSFVMTFRFPFSLMISFESSSRSNCDPRSANFFGRPDGLSEIRVDGRPSES
jgi:hypothetical protein